MPTWEAGRAVQLADQLGLGAEHRRGGRVDHHAGRQIDGGVVDVPAPTKDLPEILGWEAEVEGELVRMGAGQGGGRAVGVGEGPVEAEAAFEEAEGGPLRG